MKVDVPPQQGSFAAHMLLQSPASRQPARVVCPASRRSAFTMFQYPQSGLRYVQPPKFVEICRSFLTFCRQTNVLWPFCAVTFLRSFRKNHRPDGRFSQVRFCAKRRGSFENTIALLIPAAGLSQVITRPAEFAGLAPPTVAGWRRQILGIGDATDDFHCLTDLPP